MFNFPTKEKKTKKIIQPEPVNEEVVNQLEDQISRGKKGFGALIIDKNKDIKIKRATEITKILLDIYTNKSPMIILHHRNPTSSENKLSQTHPLLTSDGSLKYNYYTIHNGVISNTEELKEKHEKLGFLYKTIRTNEWNQEEYNDSESLAIELARYIEEQTNEISIEGSAAFIIIQVDKKTNKAVNTFFGRKDNPLKLSGKQGEIKLSSEGKGENIPENILYKFNIKSPKLTKIKLKFETKKEEKEEKEEKPFVYPTEKKYLYGTEKEKEEKKKWDKNWETKEENATEIDNDLEIISEEFVNSTTEIIEQFALKLEEAQQLNQIDIESEKKDLAVEIITNVQKSYNLALDTAQESLYDNIEEESKRRIEEDEEKAIANYDDQNYRKY